MTKTGKHLVPPYNELILPAFNALKQLGGSGTNKDILNAVIKNLALSEDAINAMHTGKGKNKQTELEYRLGWALSYLKKYGAVNNNEPAKWTIEPEFSQIGTVDPKDVVKTVRKSNKNKASAGELDTDPNDKNENLSNIDSTARDARNYWWLNANPKMWRFSDVKIGEEENYTLYTEKGKKRRIFKNFLEAKTGDVIIGYEASPERKITSIAQVTGRDDKNEKKLYFKKVAALTNPIPLDAFKDAEELSQMEWIKNNNGSLFKLTAAEYDFLMGLIRKENPDLPDDWPASEKTVYDKNSFLKDVYIDGQKYDSLVGMLKFKKNIILQGAPGVGKTFAAKRLAYSIMGEKDENRVEFVQFHQNYSYEDFVMGYKPDKDGFILTEGVFYKFCQKAAYDPDRDYFFIIDEINRGNMSKIFGELLMLIEKDYRGEKIKLAYEKDDGKLFGVPKNLYIIGMMNTADRSLAMIDYALRRRFSFFDMEPGFDSDGFNAHKTDLNNEKFNNLVKEIKNLNGAISADPSLGKGFRIGHSYLCDKDEAGSDEGLQRIVEYDILPMLAEYWFDDKAKYDAWAEKLRIAVGAIEQADETKPTGEAKTDTVE